MRTKSIILFALLVAAAAGGTRYVTSDAPRRMCARMHHWFVWGSGRPAPPTCGGEIYITRAPSSSHHVSGTILYTRGHHRRTRGRDLPVRHIDITFGGLRLRVEDGRRSTIPAVRAAARGGESIIAASIRGCFDAGDERIIDYCCFRFDRGKTIELALPFSIAIEPGGSASDAGSYAITLGELAAAGEQRWNGIDELWQPTFSTDERVRVAVEMFEWEQRTRYATVVLDEPLAPETEICAEGQWHLRARGREIVCEALQSGSAAGSGWQSLPM